MATTSKKGKPLPRTCPVRGFRFAHAAAKLRYARRSDLALIVSDGPCVAAGVFTQNRVAAAPVMISREHLQASRVHRAILLNAGRANAGTGLVGLRDARHLSRELAMAVGCSQQEVLLCSTGVIGQRIQVRKVVNVLPQLVADLDAKGFPPLAKAIMTTDTFPKYAACAFAAGGRRYHLAGIAKGAGMIEPNMATMLSVLVTDAPLAKSALQRALQNAVADSFNSITIDGDTSTNDTVLLLSSGASGGKPLAPGTQGYVRFLKELGGLSLKLAKMIVQDGEGATKFVNVQVRGARTLGEARACAKTIANSPLVKTAMAGEDPNWGRILAAAGRSGARFAQERVRLDIGRVRLVSAGRQVSAEAEKRAHAVMKKPSYDLTLHLGAGRASATVYTCDLTREYISINADYRS